MSMTSNNETLTNENTQEEEIREAKVSEGTSSTPSIDALKSMNKTADQAKEDAMVSTNQSNPSFFTKALYKLHLAKDPNAKEYERNPNVKYKQELVDNDVLVSVRHLKMFFPMSGGRKLKAVHDVSFDIKKG